VLLGAGAAAREREDQSIIALWFAELPQCARVIGQLVAGNVFPETTSGRMFWTSLGSLPPRLGLEQHPKNHQVRDGYDGREEDMDVPNRGQVEGRDVQLD
jgi:hypothetical protein